jgi:hypothetical protein
MITPLRLNKLKPCIILFKVSNEKNDSTCGEALNIELSFAYTVDDFLCMAFTNLY